MHKTVIVNTSPLFYLHRLGYFNLLEKLYGEIVIPEAVVAELEEGEQSGEDVPKIAKYNWIKIKKVTITSFKNLSVASFSIEESSAKIKFRMAVPKIVL